MLQRRDAPVLRCLSTAQENERGTKINSQFIVNANQIESAALYPEGNGEYVQCARVGEPPKLKSDDALWRYCLESGTLVLDCNHKKGL